MLLPKRHSCGPYSRKIPVVKQFSVTDQLEITEQQATHTLFENGVRKKEEYCDERNILLLQNTLLVDYQDLFYFILRLFQS